MKKLLLFGLFVLFSITAHADVAQVAQQGSVTATHFSCFVGNGIIKDCGTSTSGYGSTLGVTNNGGYGIGIQTSNDHITNPYWQMLFGLNHTHAFLDVEPFAGGAAIPFDIIINGSTVFSIGGSGDWLSDVFDEQFGDDPGEILCRSATGWVALASGTPGYVLSAVSGACPAWISAGSPVTPVIHVVSSGNTYTAVTTDVTVAWNSATTSPKAQTIFACAGGTNGLILFIKDEKGTAATYPIVITPASGTIDNAASYTMSFNLQATQLQCDGTNTNWIVL